MEVKSVNRDKRVKNRFRFQSSKQKAKFASADVYRSYKRRIGVTSAASREERVHHPHREETANANKRQRTGRTGSSDGGGERKAVIRSREGSSTDVNTIVVGETASDQMDLSATQASFSEELDLAFDRNASEIFGNFYREIWPSVRSLPEVLHHSSKIIEILLAYMLSDASEPGEKSHATITHNNAQSKDSKPGSSKRNRFIINYATTDILHLLGVLAKDLRHEIHPYLHSQIIPRIVTDLLNPPSPAIGEDSEKLTDMPLDVSVIEAAFRCLSYVFRYDAEELISEVDNPGNDPCLEKLRQYYGSTLAHRRDVARRLAAETFAPLVRKLKHDSSRRKHLRRVIRALVVSQKNAVTSSSALKIQSNAVDGISQFFFEVTRGVAGQLHSTGRVAAKVLLDFLCSEDKGMSSLRSRELVHSVTSSFLDKVCQHLHRDHFVDLLDDIVKAAHQVLTMLESKLNGELEAETEFQLCPLEHMVRILDQLVSFRDGFLLNGHKGEYKFEGQGRLMKVVLRIIDAAVPSISKFSSREIQTATLSLICNACKAVPNDDKFLKRIQGYVSPLLQNRTVLPAGVGDQENGRHPAHVLAEDLMPFLPARVAMNAFGSSILSAAADLADEDLDLSLSLILSVVSIKSSSDSENHSDFGDDVLFSTDVVSQCTISSGVKDKLIARCLLDYKKGNMSKVRLSQLGVAARCVPFLVLTETNEKEADGVNESFYSCSKNVSEWLMQLFSVCADEAAEKRIPDGDDFAITASLALESLSTLSTVSFERLNSLSWFKKNLFYVKDTAEKLLLSRPSSLWTVRATAFYVEALQHVDGSVHYRDEIFDEIVPNLRSSSHYRRLYSLRVLRSFPKKPFVTDHADLDLTGDLDEEPDIYPQMEREKGAVVRTGLCDILDTLLAIESTPVELENERQLSSLVTRIEILGRTAKLPVVYTEAAANHMLGILYIKFAPIWKVAVRAFVSLATGQEDIVWAPLREKISDLLTSFRNSGQIQQGDAGDDVIATPLHHHAMCRAWEMAHGLGTSICGKKSTLRLPTDETTVFEYVLRILETGQQLLMKHNREFVPIFLKFMHSQYYSYYCNDPDARELGIEKHIDNAAKVERHLLQAHIMKKRLASMLKVFAAVKGPKQLFKHDVLLSIFISLLNIQDPSLGQLALSCVATFKLPYLTPLLERMEALFAKGGLKESLLKFTTALESVQLDTKQRQCLIPVLMRVLFGRLTSRATSKSSKDSPAARRAAVLSFISSLCKDESELYPFIYLMIRSYVPSEFNLLSVEEHGAQAKREVLEKIKTVSVQDLAALPTQVHIGFLHLLEPIVAHLGHRVASFVDQFLCIIVTLCEMAQVKQSAVGETDIHGDEGSEEVELDDDDKPKGLGNIRTLCFRRLSGIFSQFCETIDFKTHSPAMWTSIKTSVDMLPATAVNCEKPPALLSFMVTLSSYPELIDVLSGYEQAVPCVIKCLAPTSHRAVVDMALTFIDHLLVGEPDSGESGVQLLTGHIELILCQFMSTLGKNSVSGDASHKNRTAESSEKPPSKHQLHISSCRRELDILCRISELLEKDEAFCESEGSRGVAEQLCTLLIPFLEQGRCGNDIDQLNVLRILRVLVPKTSHEAGSLYFQQLSRLLGPGKTGPGLASMPVRKEIVSVIHEIQRKIDTASIQISGVLEKLCRSHPKRVDEIDYDSVIPALNSLSEVESDTSWLSLSKLVREDSSRYDIKLLSPIIYTCFHFLFEDDSVVSRIAFRALKTLIVLAAKEAGLPAEKSDRNLTASEQCGMLLERSIIPLIRNGLETRNATARRLYILLIAEVARCCKDSSNPNLYGDLSALVREDDEDLDFFLNITHVQIHRRTRAFQRLRRKLSEIDRDDFPFTLQSLSNILLPIALHPVYESKTKLEETFAVEAVATVGVISRHLSWSKYNNLLWTSLTQFHRHPEQERYLIAMICAIIDGFHFDFLSSGGKNEEVRDSTAVARALERRFIPKIQSLMTKEKIDKSGSKIETLRSPVILALVKLFKKLSADTLHAELPRLLTVICGGLKSRDSDSRDVARGTLAKVVLEIGMVYLPDVLRELTIALHEGFRLHVRMATIHSILLALSAHYKPPENCTDEEASGLSFDKSVPALMDLIQQDLFGNAQERKEAEGVQGRYVKEAGGSKSHNSLELIASLIAFRPSLAQIYGTSGIHSLVSPLLGRLRMPDVETGAIRRIKECLSRIVTGVARNPTVTLEEALPFVHATAAPFVGDENVITSFTTEDNDDMSSDDDEPHKALSVSGSTRMSLESQGSTVATITSGKVTDWRPSAFKAPKSTKAAAAANHKEARDLIQLQDGAAAPKLTGSSRFRAVLATTSQINEPSNIGAVVFSLRLLYSVLKKKKLKASDDNLLRLINPFVPLLSACVCASRETEIVLLSLRCLGLFLYLDLPSKGRFTTALGSKTVELLNTSSVGSDEDNELTQACFKMLTILMNIDQGERGDTHEMFAAAGGEYALSKGAAMPLNSEQMKVLISFLQEAIINSENHNTALNLLKAIMSRRYLSPEFYDLMETILEQSVRSHKANLRQLSTGVMINYLLNYPIGPERFEQHLKQIVVNMRYEREEGRESAINLASLIVDKLPLPELEKHVQLFFLPLTLQLVNDDSKKCREAIADCLTNLLSRVSIDAIQSLYDFACRWSQNEGQVQRCALQLFGFFIEARLDFMKRGDTALQLFERLKKILVDRSNHDETEWEVFYFSFLCLERLSKPFPELFPVETEVWSVIIDCLAHPHPFVKLVSSRLINGHLESLDPLSFAEGDASSRTFVYRTPGTLYRIAKNLCFQLNVEEGHQSDDVTAFAIKNLCWLLPAMNKYPGLCICDQRDGNDRATESPVGWVMKRLSSIAKPKGPKRRQAIFKAFAAFATECPDVVLKHMELMLEPLHRVDVETINDKEKPTMTVRSGRMKPVVGETIPEEAIMARDVLHLLEEKSDCPEEFLRAYAVVKTQRREKKENRKLLVKSEAVRDPQAAAKRKQLMNEKERKRKKRRVEDRRRERGATAKRSRHLD